LVFLFFGWLVVVWGLGWRRWGLKFFFFFLVFSLFGWLVVVWRFDVFFPFGEFFGDVYAVYSNGRVLFLVANWLSRVSAA